MASALAEADEGQVEEEAASVLAEAEEREEAEEAASALAADPARVEAAALFWIRAAPTQLS